MAGPVLYRRSPAAAPEAAPVRRPEGHGRSRARRERRLRRRICPPVPAAVRERGALIVLVIAACASLLTSIYLVALIS
ncbi:MAG: hypothetical protein ACT4P1_15605 [Sporichthyaceae bacterium]